MVITCLGWILLYTPEGCTLWVGMIFWNVTRPKRALYTGKQRRSNTTALVRSTAEILETRNYPSSLPFAPKDVACWYKLFKNSLTEFHIQPDFSLTELNIAIMVIPFNTLFVVITTSPPQNTPLFANLCTVLS